MSEVEGLFDFLQEIYGKFGFNFKLKLSTRYVVSLRKGLECAKIGL